MQRVDIWITGQQRLVIHPNGGCHLQKKEEDGTWLNDNGPCDTQSLLLDAADAIKRCGEHIGLVS